MANYYREVIKKLDDLVKSRFIEMISKGDYPCVCVGELMTQANNVVRINHPEKEKYITLSGQGKGVRQRIIHDGKTPVKFNGYRVKTGQFIYSRIDARNGAFAIVPDNLNNAVVSKDFPVFDLNKKLVSPEFLLSSLLQGSFVKQVQSSSFGATNRQRIKEDVFAKYSIKLPPLDVQKDFSAFVQQVDKSKIIAQKAAEKYEQLVKSRFIEMFGTSADPKYGQVRIADLVSKDIEKMPKKYSSEDIIDYIDISSIDKESRSIVGTTEYAVKDAPSRAQQCVINGDILLSNVRPNLKTLAIVNSNKNNLVCSTGFTVLRCTDSCPEYLTIAITDDYFTDKLVKKANGSNYPAVTSKDVYNSIIPSASIELQKQFATFIQQVDKSKFTDAGGTH